MVPPPLEEKHGQSGHCEPAPELSIGLLQLAGSYSGVAAEWQFFPWRDVALRRVDEIHAKGGRIGSRDQTVNALFECFSDHQFARFGIDFQQARLAIRAGK